MKKLNNKGYMLVEIIIASVIAFSVAYYLINLTIKFKDQNADLYNNTIIKNDKTNITKNIMNDLEAYKDLITNYSSSSITCDSINTMINYNQIKNICDSNTVILNGCSDGGTITISPISLYSVQRVLIGTANIKKIEISNKKTLKYTNYEISDYNESDPTSLYVNPIEIYTKNLENGNEFTDIDCSQYNNRIIKIGITNIYSDSTEYIKLTW